MIRALACTLLFSFSTAFAQSPTTLSVVVTDAKGNRIRSLTRDDFLVVNHGTRNAIVGFSERATVPRRIAVVFDLTSMSIAARSTAIDALRGFFSTSLRPGDRVILLTAGQSLTPVSSWTADQAEIDAALQHAAVGSSMTMAGDRQSAEKRIGEMITDIQQSTTFYHFDAIVEAVRGYAAMVFRDSKQSIGLMTAATNLFPPRASRNVMIVVGAGLPVRAGADLFQYLEGIKAEAERGQLGAALRQGASRSSPLSETSSFDLSPVLRELASEARQNGVAIYAIDSEMAEGASTQVEANRTTDRMASFATVANRSAGYQLIADETGGLALLGRKPREALSEILSDLDSFYSISITPGIDPIEVRSKGGYKVRVARGGTQPTADAEIRNRVVAYHLVKPESNDLGISLQTAPPVPDGDKRHVSLKVMIPIRNLKLTQEGDFVTGGFTVYLATGDARGNTSNVNKQTKEIRWPAEALKGAEDKKLTFAVDVVLEPGRTQISVGVLDDKSEMTGYDRVTI